MTPGSAPAVWVIAALGQSPGVLTELVWALCDEGHDIVGFEVWTTSAGQSRLAEDIGSPAWMRLKLAVHPRWFPHAPHPDTLDDHPPPAAADVREAVRRRDTFAVQVLCDAGGAALSDIRSTADADAVQEALFDRVDQLASALPPGVQLVGSVAGGRKTLSAALQAAFSMHAPVDARLVHVLVHPHMERPFPRLQAYRFPGDGSQEAWIAAQPDPGSHPPVPRPDQQITLTDIPYAPLAAWRYHHDDANAPSWGAMRQLRRAAGPVRGRLTFVGVDEVWTLEALDADGSALCDPIRLDKMDGLVMAGVLAAGGGAAHKEALAALYAIPEAVPHLPPEPQDAEAWDKRVKAFKSAVGKLRKQTEPLRALGLSDLVYRKDARGIVAHVDVKWSV
ncbi:MAG: CRISPR-associated protein (TIGR02584 family) [Myxococcota bacterium]|jgi:CRISPR-associated protein (TIGR02584 family)